MKARTVIIIAMAACLLMGSVAFGQSYSRHNLLAQGSALAQSNVPSPSVQYLVAQGVASGGSYRLTGLAWQVSGASYGGEYRLQGPAKPSGGTPCCCVFLPCVKK